MIGLLSENLIELSQDVFGVNAMVGCALVAVLALPILWMMPETLGKKVE